MWNMLRVGLIVWLVVDARSLAGLRSAQAALAPLPALMACAASCAAPDVMINACSSALDSPRVHPQPQHATTALDVVLNEFMPAPNAGEQEWVEVYNRGAAPVDLSGWSIDDMAGGSSPRAIPQGVLLEPGAWYVLAWSGAVFNNAGDEVRLLDAHTLIVDTVSYTSAPHGLTYSRIPDGSGPWCAGTQPSPASANQPASVPPTPTATTTAPATPVPSAPATPTGTTTVPSATATAAPSTATAVAPAAIVINEFLAAPTAGAAEWVELYNVGATPVDLGGWRIDDSAGGAPAQLVPSGTTIAPARWYVFTLAGSLLNNTGDEVRLLDAHGNVVDVVPYSAAHGDVSISRFPDGAPAWLVDTPPTPNAANQAPAPTATATPTAAPSPTATTPSPAPYPATVALNEVLAVPESGGEEWVELYNYGATSVDLSGWSIDDAPGGAAPKPLPVGTQLAPGGWYVLAWSGSLLNNAGDEVRLLNPAGTVIDHMRYTQAQHDQSISRVPDGAGPWQAATPPTPGAANQALIPTATFSPATAPPATSTAPPPAPYPATVALNELLAVPESGGEEWVELYNYGATSVDLSGWSIDDAPGGSAPKPLPVGTQLAPGDWYVFSWSGSLLNNAGDEVRLLNPAGIVIDHMRYTQAQRGRSISRVPDATGAWQLQTPPTPRQANKAAQVTPTPRAAKQPQHTPTAPAQQRAPTAQTHPPAVADDRPTSVTVVLNEVLAVPDSGDAEWVELYNYGATSVDLSGWSIDDTPGGSAPKLISVGTQLAPGGWYVLTWSGSLLNNAGDEVRLLDPAGTVIDQLRYTQAQRGRSISRVPDATGAWQTNTAASPGAANSKPLAADSAPAAIAPGVDTRPDPTASSLAPLVEPTPTPTPLRPVQQRQLVASPILLSQLSITSADAHARSVEVVNRSYVSLDLAGWQLELSTATTSATWTIPQHTLIEAHDYRRFTAAEMGFPHPTTASVVRLLTPDQQIADRFEYAADQLDAAWMRWPAPDGPWQVQLAATSDHTGSVEDTAEPAQTSLVAATAVSAPALPLTENRDTRPPTAVDEPASTLPAWPLGVAALTLGLAWMRYRRGAPAATDESAPTPDAPAQAE